MLRSPNSCRKWPICGPANGIIIREQEQKYLAERDRIAAEYQTTIEGLKAAHDKEIIDLNRLRDTVRVPECVPVSADKRRCRSARKSRR